MCHLQAQSKVVLAAQSLPNNCRWTAKPLFQLRSDRSGNVFLKPEQLSRVISTHARTEDRMCHQGDCLVPALSRLLPLFMKQEAGHRTHRHSIYKKITIDECACAIVTNHETNFMTSCNYRGVLLTCPFASSDLLVTAEESGCAVILPVLPASPLSPLPLSEVLYLPSCARIQHFTYSTVMLNSLSAQSSSIIHFVTNCSRVTSTCFETQTP